MKNSVVVSGVFKVSKPKVAKVSGSVRSVAEDVVGDAGRAGKDLRRQNFGTSCGSTAPPQSRLSPTHTNLTSCSVGANVNIGVASSYDILLYFTI